MVKNMNLRNAIEQFPWNKFGRNFWHIACLEYLDKYKSVIVALTTSEDPAVRLHATRLLHSIENPKQYKFNG